MRLKLAGVRGFFTILDNSSGLKILKFSTSYMGVCLLFIIHALLDPDWFHGGSSFLSPKQKSHFFKRELKFTFCKKYIVK